MSACACLFARGSVNTGFGLHFAPHRPRAEFLRHPGSGGLRGATRPAPQHPPRARPSAGSCLRGRRAAALSPASGARGCVGGRREGDCARGGAPGACVGGRGVARGWRTAEPEAAQNRAVASNQGRNFGGMGVGVSERPGNPHQYDPKAPGNETL